MSRATVAGVAAAPCQRREGPRWRTAVARRVMMPVVVAALAGAHPLGAHAQAWHVEARAGLLDFGAGAESLPRSTTIGIGLGYARPHSWLQLTTGIPFSGEDPLWAAADAGGRIAWSLGGLTGGVDLAGQGFVQRYSRTLDQPGGVLTPPSVIEGTAHGFGIAGQVMPVVAYEHRRFSAQARGGVARYHSTLGEQDATRRVGVGEVRLGMRPTASLQLMLDGRQYRADERGYTFAGVTALVAGRRASAWGSVGQWLDPSDVPVSWSAGAAFALAGRLELIAGARRDAIDPLYGSLPRRSYSVGMRLGLGASGPAPRPVPAAYVGGRATIALPAGEVEGEPRVAGDFNNWRPASMTRRGDAWTYTVALQPGVYEYAFVTNDGTWFVPASTPGRRDDGMGGHVALLVVGEQP